jgi:hypothetical protein
MLKAYSLRFSCALILILGCALALPAQITTGEITGTVMDQSGAEVAGAAVSAVCPDTNQTRSVTSGGAGEYRLSEMPACVYKVSVFAQGFKTTVREVSVNVAQTTKADFRLQLGERTETITVEAAAPLVDFSPGVNNEVDTKSILDLPTEGRDFKSILALTPGVQRSPGGGFLDVSVSGQRTTTNNYMIDGMPNNDRFYGSELVGQPGILGVPAAVLGNDVIAEYTVQQLPTAENGVKGGAAINVTLKSGTNDFHGAGYYFGDYDWLNSKNFFSTTTTPYHNHNYGATLGGPIIKDRTFFFVNYEGYKNKLLTPYTVSIPTQGDLNAALAFINDPVNNPNGVPVNPAGQNVLKFFPIDPSSTPGGATKDVALPISNTLTSFMVKIDHKVNSKVSISGRYLYADSLQSAPVAGYTLPPPSGSGLGPDGFNTIAPTRVQLAGATVTWAVSSNKILDVRFNWSRYAQVLGVNNKINPKSLGIDTGPLAPTDFGVPVFYASNVSSGYIGGVVGYPLSTRPTQNYNTSVHYTWIRGTHTFKMGGNYDYASTFSLRNRARTPFTDLNEDWTTTLESLLVGRVDRANRSFGDTSRHLFEPSTGLYVQDEWKFTPRVTISYGLRWDLNGALGDADKVASNFYPCAPPEPSMCPPGGAPAGLVRVGTSNPRLYGLDFRDFGPRAGLAWDVFGNGKTAFRVGYSMAYDVANFAAISAPYAYQGDRAGAFTNSDLGVFAVSARATGLSALRKQCCTDFGNGTISLAQYDAMVQPILLQALGANTCYNPGVNTGNYSFVCFGPQPGSAAFGGSSTVPFQTFGANPTSTPPFNIAGVVSPLRTPRIQYYSATIQQQVFSKNAITLSYIGAHGTDMFLNRSLNQRPIGCFAGGNQLSGPPNSGANNPTSLNCDRPFTTLFPQFGIINQLTNQGYSRYNAMQLGYRQRDWHGLNSIINFTWSNCIDTNSVNRGGSSAGALPIAENPYNPNSNRGPCDTDIRLNFTSGVTYDVHKWRAVGRLGEGWQVGGIVTALTGRPWTPQLDSSADNSGQDAVYQRPDCLAKPIYQFSDPNSPTITNAATAFGPPTDGTIGTCGRNSLRGPRFVQFDANLNKITKITERLSIQLRWEVFNALNHPNFVSTPTTSARNPLNLNSFSKYGQTNDVSSGNPFLSQGGPRAMQLGVKLIF